MNEIEYSFYPHGKRKALTFSYDDGRNYDVRLSAIFDKYNMKGTFNINSKFIGNERYMTKEQMIQLSKNHELACHSHSHPYLTNLPSDKVMSEMLENRKFLEENTKIIARGMAYPYGTYDQRIKDCLSSSGIDYSRTVISTRNFEVPTDFLSWNPTIHHNDALRFIDSFLARNYQMPLFYIWGHSYEFAEQNTWDLIEEICSKLANKDDIWYATNGEIYDYVTALRGLKFNFDNTIVINNSSLTLYISVNKKLTEIKSGVNYL